MSAPDNIYAAAPPIQEPDMPPPAAAIQEPDMPPPPAGFAEPGMPPPPAAPEPKMAPPSPAEMPMDLGQPLGPSSGVAKITLLGKSVTPKQLMLILGWATATPVPLTAALNPVLLAVPPWW